MIDVKKIREDFPMYKNFHPKNGYPLTYLDNAATTFKPWEVIKAEEAYYTSFTAILIAVIMSLLMMLM